MRQATHVPLLWLALLGGCDGSQDEPAAPANTAQTQLSQPAAATPTTTTPPEPPATSQVPLPPAPEKGESAALPAGKLVLGSHPVTPHRNAAVEADLVEVDVAGFAIDRLPYPNDPGAPAMTGVTRPQAAKLCADAGKRLCTEAEWERACKTDAGHAYPTGDALDLAQCRAAGPRCGNALGAMTMGIAAREWTASEWPRGFGNAMRTAVTRGASAAADASAHRCAARSGATEDSTSESIGFRCCSGDSARFSYPTEPKRRLVAPLDAKPEALRAALATHPELAPLAPDFKRFNGGDIARALARGKRSRGSITAWHIADSAFIWSPGPGQELWVLGGFSGERTVVAAFHTMPDGSLVHAASTVVDEPDTSAAFGYTDDKPTQLLWTTCFGCPGEGGDLLVSEDGLVRFTYR